MPGRFSLFRRVAVVRIRFGLFCSQIRSQHSNQQQSQAEIGQTLGGPTAPRLHVVAELVRVHRQHHLGRLRCHHGR